MVFYSRRRPACYPSHMYVTTAGKGLRVRERRAALPHQLTVLKLIHNSLKAVPRTNRATAERRIHGLLP